MQTYCNTYLLNEIEKYMWKDNKNAPPKKKENWKCKYNIGKHVLSGVKLIFIDTELNWTL